MALYRVIIEIDAGNELFRFLAAGRIVGDADRKGLASHIEWYEMAVPSPVAPENILFRRRAKKRDAHEITRGAVLGEHHGVLGYQSRDFIDGDQAHTGVTAGGERPVFQYAESLMCGAVQVNESSHEPMIANFARKMPNFLPELMTPDLVRCQYRLRIFTAGRWIRRTIL